MRRITAGQPLRRGSFGGLGVADFNADGRADIVASDVYAGWVSVLWNDGGGPAPISSNNDARSHRRLDSAPILATARRNDAERDRRQQVVASTPAVTFTESDAGLGGAMTAVIAGPEVPSAPR